MLQAKKAMVPKTKVLMQLPLSWAGVGGWGEGEAGRGTWAVNYWLPLYSLTLDKSPHLSRSPFPYLWYEVTIVSDLLYHLLT